jgi:hypothetical protein
LITLDALISDWLAEEKIQDFSVLQLHNRGNNRPYIIYHRDTRAFIAYIEPDGISPILLPDVDYLRPISANRPDFFDELGKFLKFCAYVLDRDEFGVMTYYES